MTEIEQVIRAAGHFETLLRNKYRAHGNGLGSKTLSVRRNLHQDIVDKLLYIAQVRNKIAHGTTDRLPDKKRFEETVSALEGFFKESLFTDTDKNPTWTEWHPVTVWPKQLISSREKRLYYHVAGGITVCPPGKHWITTLGKLTEAGFVCMTSQSLQQMEIEPLRSKDQLPLVMSVSISAVVIENPEKIRTVVIDAEQQVETLNKQVLLCLQRICAKKNYDDVSPVLHEIAEEVKQAVNSKATSDGNASFIIGDCAIIECRLEDSELEEMRRSQLRTIQEAKKKSEELTQLTEIEKRQLQSFKEKADLENQLALDASRHLNELQNVRNEGDTAIIIKRADLERTLAVEASKAEINIRKNKVIASIEELRVVEAKAGIAGSPGGKRALYPDETFEIEKRELNMQAEFWKAKFSDRKMQQLMSALAGAGFDQGKLETLKEVMAQQLNVAVSERPQLTLSESNGDKSTATTASEPLKSSTF